MPRFALFAIAALAGGVAAGHAAETPPPMAPHEVAAALRGGGLVLYMRHPETERAQADAEALDLADCATQRNLSEAGRRTAAAVGAALRSVGAAFDRTVTSEYCRARDTAALMALAAEADGALNDGGRMAASGPAFADLAEGEVAAFRPAAPGEPPGFRAVSRVRPQDWPAITAAAARD